MQIPKSYASQNPESHESQGIIRFDRSLQELRDLRSQLHNAASHCETTFLKTNQKRMVLESTKEYLCRAVVAVVDHLGCVSANLNNNISNNCAFSEAELRINCLKQRLLSCEKYAHRVALTRVRWNAYLPKHHHRYLSTQITSAEKSNEDARDSNSQAPTKILLAKHEFVAEQLPLFLHTRSQKSAPTKNLWSGISTGKGDPNSVPVRDGLSILSRISNPTFHFQKCSSRNGRSTIFRKSSAHSRDIFSLIRRAKRTP
ncbi:hypothetical protein Peur_068280 [Populus x canadensis]